MALHKTVLDFLKKHNSSTTLINSLIVSNYLYSNNIIEVKNSLINSFLLTEQDENYSKLKEYIKISKIENFETLIETFEFVISPSDKIINGAVYTPKYIRNYIAKKGFEQLNIPVDQIIVADISCGCGGFLLSAAELIKSLTNKTFHQIFSDNLFGIDITSYSVERAKLLLSLLALYHKEDEIDFSFNLVVGNSLTYDWRTQYPAISENDGFDLIVGNPPYVASRNMDEETLELIKTWKVAQSGHPDLYIPFFQIGVENLTATGILGYITVNTFIKSINGRALRSYFESTDINLTILNFGGEQVFKDRNTYTCICFLERGNGQVNYVRTQSSLIEDINFNELKHFNYMDLDHNDGWNLVNNNQLLDYINVIEGTGTPFKNLYNTKNGIATLKNDVYKFRPITSDNEFYYLKDESGMYPIEREICRDIVNANKIRSVEDIDDIKEKIIFPYNNEIRIFDVATMQQDYPRAFAYLETKRIILAGRDKGNREYETWYAYGRRQSMDIQAYKLFFPHICERPTFVICEEQDLLFYNGMAVVSGDLRDLQVLKKIMESDLFFEYIRNTTKDYSSGYISMSRNYIKNFGIYPFTEEQKQELLATENADDYLEALYFQTNEID
jgi:adenine-specific DNA-methyltransferase